VSSNAARCIGVMGGTFDPIHYGHLRTALELRERLRLDHVRFIPCNDPPTSKRPLLDAATRLRIVRAAIESEPDFVADSREIDRGGVSYTADTLMSLRADFTDRPLALIMGMDAFLSLPEWRNWTTLVDYAHIVVAHRPGWKAPRDGVLGKLVADRAADSVGTLHEELSGRVYIAEVTQLEISSTALRSSISLGVDPKYLVPPAVRSIVLEMECYAGTTVREQEQIG
jgi:nicotinate-nucleotide adenylyltransferase